VIAALQKQVVGLREEVDGFARSVEEVRAAGRVEAMEDLMTNLAEHLVRRAPCNHVSLVHSIR
jgi:hypothetical protein